MPWVRAEKLLRRQLNLNEYARIECSVDPANNRYEFGPQLVRLNGPFERISKVDSCPKLDQGDYII